MKRGNRGLTLVEVTIASVVLLFLTAGVFALIYRGSSTYSYTAKKNTLQRNAQIVLDRISEELRTANPDNIVASVGYLSYQVPQSVSSAGIVTWGSTFVYATEDSFVDADNDGNKKTTDFELRLMRYDQAAPADKVKLCDYIKRYDSTTKKGGFVAAYDNASRKLTLSITLVAVDDLNKEIEIVVSTSIFLRNASSS